MGRIVGVGYRLLTENLEEYQKVPSTVYGALARSETTGFGDATDTLTSYIQVTTTLGTFSIDLPTATIQVR